MREIKFRGKRVDNGELVYGGLWISKVNDYYIITADYLKIKERTGLMSIGTLEDETHMQWVKRDTVGQFTGLLDKNGKDIYEGDILKATQKMQSKNGVVVFRNGGLWWEFEKGRYSYLNEVVNKFNGELIGNIHDNPELLK